MTRHDELNTQVTSAIWNAEHLVTGSTEAKAAWLEVSRLEEEIAKITGRDDMEGRIARRGAITAAINAGEVELARTLLTNFITNGDIDPASITEVRKLFP